LTPPLIAADTSVAVAAFASWHAQHELADRALQPGTRLVAHSALETYSVLTRLPAPYRAAAGIARDYLAARFPEPFLCLDADAYKALVTRLAGLGISGGATYDALIATTATSAGARLLSCDVRAAATYQRCGADVELLQASG
jgi:predicted nucleic acid-binding protein